MENLKTKNQKGIKVKFGMPLILASLICLSFLPLSTSLAQDSEDVKEIAEFE